MNKTDFIRVRITTEEKSSFIKAAKAHTSLSGFLLRTVRQAIKYRKLLESGQTLAKNENIKPSYMKASV